MRFKLLLGTQYGNRTRLSALKGQRPKPIDELSIKFWGPRFSLYGPSNG